MSRQREKGRHIGNIHPGAPGGKKKKGRGGRKGKKEGSPWSNQCCNIALARLGGRKKTRGKKGKEKRDRSRWLFFTRKKEKERKGESAGNILPLPGEGRGGQKSKENKESG